MSKNARSIEKKSARVKKDLNSDSVCRRRSLRTRKSRYRIDNVNVEDSSEEQQQQVCKQQSDGISVEDSGKDSADEEKAITSNLLLLPHEASHDGKDEDVIRESDSKANAFTSSTQHIVSRRKSHLSAVSTNEDECKSESAKEFPLPSASSMKQTAVPLDFLSNVLGLKVYSKQDRLLSDEAHSQSTASVGNPVGKMTETRVCNESARSETTSTSMFSPKRSRLSTTTNLTYPTNHFNLTKPENFLTLKESSASNTVPAVRNVDHIPIKELSQEPVSPKAQNVWSPQIMKEIQQMPEFLEQSKLLLQNLISMAASRMSTSQTMPLQSSVPPPSLPSASVSCTTISKNPFWTEENPPHTQAQPQTSFSRVGNIELSPAQYQSICSQDADGDTPLHITTAKRDRAACKVLISALDKRSLNISNEMSQTPLHIATYIGDIGIMSDLVRAGANLAVTDGDGNTPLHLACERGDEEQMKVLLGPNPVDTNGLQDAMETKNFHGDAAIHVAIRLKKEKIVMLLIEAGCDVDIQDFKAGKTPLLQCLELEMFDLARYLVKMGASVNSQSYNDNLPLHIASQKGHLSLVNLLIDKGSQISVKNVESASPKDLAQSKQIRGILDREMVRIRRKRQSKKAP